MFIASQLHNNINHLLASYSYMYVAIHNYSRNACRPFDACMLTYSYSQLLQIGKIAAVIVKWSHNKQLCLQVISYIASYVAIQLITRSYMDASNSRLKSYLSRPIAIYLYYLLVKPNSCEAHIFIQKATVGILQ